MRQAVLSTEAELIPVWAFSAQSTIAGQINVIRRGMWEDTRSKSYFTLYEVTQKTF